MRRKVSVPSEDDLNFLMKKPLEALQQRCGGCVGGVRVGDLRSTEDLPVQAIQGD